MCACGTLPSAAQEALEATFGARAVEAVLGPFPLLRALHAHVAKLPTMLAFKASTNYMPFPAGEVGRAYVANVRTAMAN